MSSSKNSFLVIEMEKQNKKQTEEINNLKSILTLQKNNYENENNVPVFSD